MAAELITPVDELSGIPLPILPQGAIRSFSESVNWHHAWHADSAPELQGLGGRAVRHSRVQLVKATDHNYGDKTRGKLTYHDFYVGPPLPTEDAARFGICVLAAAGYVPDKAIDLHADHGPRVVPMTQQQLTWLQKPAKPRRLTAVEMTRVERQAARRYESLVDPELSEAEYIARSKARFVANHRQQAVLGLHHIRYEYQPMRDFFQSIVLGQDLSHIGDSELKIEEFLLTSDPQRKMRLGRWLLARAVEMSTDNVRSKYHSLRKQGRLHPLMPPDANALVVFKLGNKDQRSQLVLQHEKELKAKLGIAA